LIFLAVCFALLLLQKQSPVPSLREGKGEKATQSKSAKQQQQVKKKNIKHIHIQYLFQR
jgi:hypothetical protein